MSEEFMEVGRRESQRMYLMDIPYVYLLNLLFRQRSVSFNHGVLISDASSTQLGSDFIGYCIVMVDFSFELLFVFYVYSLAIFIVKFLNMYSILIGDLKLGILMSCRLFLSQKMSYHGIIFFQCSHCVNEFQKINF
jgi:hypothetical protein